jgi:type VI secretion system protein VasD
MLDRRQFVIAGAALVAACGGDPPPTAVDLAVSAQPGMNSGPDGSDRPVTLLALRLRDLGAFNAADPFALQADPAAALGEDLVGLDQLAVAPGGSAEAAIPFEPEAGHLGLVALLREPTGRVWRTAIPVPPNQTTPVNVALGPGGIALGPS